MKVKSESEVAQSCPTNNLLDINRYFGLFLEFISGCFDLNNHDLSLGSDIEITMTQDYTRVSMSKIQNLTLPVVGDVEENICQLILVGMGNGTLED